ncbi:MAG: hypothetical protein IKP65_04220 [Alphaproteobacteria bacterium]|nr:hypothetical protein [Alphaproteobacteria bacterium]
MAANYPDRASNGGMFTMIGSYEFKSSFDRRFANQNEPDGLWTPDETLQLAKNENNRELEFDENMQLSKIGKDIVTVNYDGGCFRVYTFERFDNEYIESNGSKGKEINWKEHIG